MLAIYEEKFKDCLLNEIFIPGFIPILPSDGIFKKERRTHLEEKLKLWNQETKRGLDLFLLIANQDERPKLELLFKDFEKLAEQKKNIPLQSSELLFFEKMAKREYHEESYTNSSCMFRFIVTLHPLFSPAWVGWAMSEQELGHLGGVEKIYGVGLSLLPQDHYLRLFAAEYFIYSAQREKARVLLQESLLQLKKDGEQMSKTFNEISQLLEQIPRF